MYRQLFLVTVLKVPVNLVVHFNIKGKPTRCVYIWTKVIQALTVKQQKTVMLGNQVFKFGFPQMSESTVHGFKTNIIIGIILSTKIKYLTFLYTTIRFC